MIRVQRVLPSASAALSAAVLVLALAACGQDGSADCAAPSIELGTPTEDAQMVINGKNFFTECYDTGQAGTPPASTNIDLSVEYGGETIELGTVDADADGTFHATYDMPQLAADGPEQGKIIATGGTSDATLEFTVAK